MEKENEILEDLPSKPKNKISFDKFKWPIIAIAALIIIVAVFKEYTTPEVIITPTPSPSEEVWKTKSEKNVRAFIDNWINSFSAEVTSETYALKAEDLLTNVARAKLAAYKDEKGNPITKVSLALNKFVGISLRPQSYEIISTTKIDEENVEVRANIIIGSSTKVLLFNTTSVGGMWLIDSVIDKGTQ